MNKLCQNHRFVFSDGVFKLYIINGKVFLEDSGGNLQGLNTINPALCAKTSNSNHIFESITKTIDPKIILNVLRKKTFSLKWIQVF